MIGRLLFLTLFVAAASGADVVDPLNRTDWTPGVRVGVIGGIPTNIAQVGATITTTGDSTDRRAEIVAALATAAASADSANTKYVKLGAGTFYVGSTITIPKFVGIVGSGQVGGTVIHTTSSAVLFRIGDDSDYRWQTPDSGGVVGAGNLIDSSEQTKDNGTFTGTFTWTDGTPASVGNMVRVLIEDQQDETLIMAGAEPVIDIGGGIFNRAQMGVITAIGGGTTTIFPPLYEDYATNLQLRLAVGTLYGDGSFLQDLQIDGTEASPNYGVQISQSRNCWFRRVTITRAKLYGFFMQDNVNLEVRQCYIDTEPAFASLPANHGGFVLNRNCASLFEHNVVKHWFPCFEINNGSTGNVFAYNVTRDVDGNLQFDINHAAHNSYNLYEYNETDSMFSDGYFGGSSRDVIHANWVKGVSSSDPTSLKLCRLTRRTAVVGNILGTSGSRTSELALGWPNAFNGSFEPAISVHLGEFWDQFKMYGILTTRTSDVAGVVTLNSGHMVEDVGTGYIRPYNYSLPPIPDNIGLSWPVADNVRMLIVGGPDGVDPSSVVGNVVTFSNLTQPREDSVLPAEGSKVRIDAGNQGFQEFDDDVEWSTTRYGNYQALAAGGGAIDVAIPGGDTISRSYFRDSKPAEFGSLSWPPFDATDPATSQSSDTRLPAGYFYANGSWPEESGGGSPTPTYNVGRLRSMRMRR